MQSKRSELAEKKHLKKGPMYDGYDCVSLCKWIMLPFFDIFNTKSKISFELLFGSATISLRRIL